MQRYLRQSLTVLLVASALCGGFSSEGRADDKVTIVLDWSSPEGIHAGLMLAAQKGWYKEAGLDADIQDGKGSNATVQQIAAGQADVGLAQLSSMAAAVSNGLPVIGIMGLARNGDNGLVIPVDSPIRSVGDLRGKTIATSSGGATASFLDAFLQTGGLTRSDLNFVLVDSSALVNVYANNSADGVLTTVGYFLPTIAKTKPSRAILFSDVGLHVPSYGLIARKSTLDSKEALLRRVVEVNQRAWQYIFAGHEQEGADAIVAQREKARPDGPLLLAQLKAYMALFETPATKGKPMGWQAETDWQEAVGVLQKAGMVKPGLSPADLYTNRFIKG